MTGQYSMGGWLVKFSMGVGGATDLHGLLQTHASFLRNIGCLRVTLEVITCTVSMADAFHPTILRLDFGVPAITGVVRHLRLQVLAETQFGFVDTDL